ncbi:MAG: hypothetical protein A4E55_01043 [Pelotomaculum sp. PtaU1.Bin035]|nr:MAG: hypothetical protein A4E55_01043 [Pelotomaculum sp. PtaU1.Bin035]
MRDLLEGQEGISTLDGEPRVIEPACFINGEVSSYDSEIMNGDQLEIKTVKTIGELFEKVDLTDQLIQVNGVEATLEYVLKDGDDVRLVKKKLTDTESADDGVERSGVGKPGGVVSVTVNGKKINLTGKKQYIFVDVLNHIELEPAAHTSPPVLRLNGAAARFTDALEEGDVIEIYWR